MKCIDSPEQRWIHVATRKLLQELSRSIYQAHSCLLAQSSGTHNPLLLVLLQETKTPSLPSVLLHLLLKLLQERQLLVLDLLEASRVELMDLASRDFEDPTQSGVGGVLLAVSRGSPGGRTSA